MHGTAAETWLVSSIAAALCAMLMIGWATVEAPEYILRGPLDLFDIATSRSPVALVIPLLAALAGAGPFVARLVNRSASLIWTRSSMRRELVGAVARSAGIVFFTFSLSVFAAFAWCVTILPTASGVRFDPVSYGLSDAAAVTADIGGRALFGDLAQYGYWTFGVTWAATTGVQAAAYCASAIGLGLLLGLPRLALFLPFLLFHIETVAFSLVGEPRFGLLYLLIPFGLSPEPPVVTGMVIAALVAVSTAAIVIPLIRVRHIRLLQ
ncbi:hypothetical protein [Agromyces archimandritae]|uniref:Uncharacterized protein n=1 Tax=Agromyces archimandritae TaxID=2781962 RepID=A0A975IP70_9MICO|nr:hypothetical protein [Agromyces archimandritae]QTX05300.1 hypothetical protein G127AT_03470 [Agromyces archimandritae]